VIFSHGARAIQNPPAGAGLSLVEGHPHFELWFFTFHFNLQLSIYPRHSLQTQQKKNLLAGFNWRDTIYELRDTNQIRGYFSTFLVGFRQKSDNSAKKL